MTNFYKLFMRDSGGAMMTASQMDFRRKIAFPLFADFAITVHFEVKI